MRRLACAARRGKWRMSRIQARLCNRVSGWWMGLLGQGLLRRVLCGDVPSLDQEQVRPVVLARDH